MLKELIQFTDSLPEELKGIGMLPKEGLHILLGYENNNGELSISPIPEFETFSKKQQEVSKFLKKCEALRQVSWMIDTNKCIDNITRAIHSASPYCLAIKRDNFEGGKNYETRKREGKTLMYNSLKNYFKKTENLIDDNKGKLLARIFSGFLDRKEKIHSWLDNIPAYKELKDSEYVIFYFDVEQTEYEKAYEKYFTDEAIFNSKEYNLSIDKEWFGTSGFFNSFNSKKPFLKHLTATFDITGRISSKEAKSLFQFESVSGRRIFPNPLPIFVYEDERKESIALFKRDALESGNKRGYREIIEDLQSTLKKELGNYYLLFYLVGEIKDFDFVSKFEYELKDNESNTWRIDDLFNCNYLFTISNVFEFERSILPIILNNALVVKTKTASLLFKYFDDIDPQYCKTDNTFLLVMKYRKTLYDFVYKSNRTGFTQKAFKDVLLTGLLDDIKLDKYENNRHSEDLTIRQKLNILFSLYQNFQPFKQDTRFMPTQILELRQGMEALASGETSLTTDEQFAFTVGQVIFYILFKSKSSDKSYSRLEPFLQMTDTGRLKQAIIKIFNTYKHENFSKRFSNPFAQVMAFTTNTTLKELMPLMLAGYFSKNQLFGEKREEETATNE
jgi:CRISPR-associated protein Csh1